MAKWTLARLQAIAGTQRRRSASEVKANWRAIVEEAKAGGEVVVTSYNRPEVVVLSMDRFAELKAQAEAHDPMERVRAELDRELALLGEPGAADRLREAFAASPEEVARSAGRVRDVG